MVYKFKEQITQIITFPDTIKLDFTPEGFFLTMNYVAVDDNNKYRFDLALSEEQLQQLKDIFNNEVERLIKLNNEIKELTFIPSYISRGLLVKRSVNE